MGPRFSRKASAREVTDAVSVSREVLYKWINRLLLTGFSERKRPAASVSIISIAVPSPLLKRSLDETYPQVSTLI